MEQVWEVEPKLYVDRAKDPMSLKQLNPIEDGLQLSQWVDQLSKHCTKWRANVTSQTVKVDEHAC